MKKGLFTLILCVCILSNFSCVRSNIEYLHSDIVPLSNVLKSQVILSEEQYMQQVKIIDTLLVLLNSGEEYFVFYSLNSLVKAGSFNVKSGDHSFFYFNQYKIEGDKRNMVLSDPASNKIIEVNLADLLDNKLQIKREYFLPYYLVRNYSYIYLSDEKSLIIGSFLGGRKQEEAGRFFIIDNKTKSTNWIKYFPQQSSDITDNLQNYYSSHSYYNDTAKVLASAMRTQNRVDFINISQGTIKSALLRKGDDGKSLYFPVEYKNADVSFFNEAFAGNRYFYALNIDGPYEKYENNVGGMKLYVFNWNGELKYICILDQMRLGTFVVDENNKKLYAVKFGKSIGDKNSLLVYDLSKIGLY